MSRAKARVRVLMLFDKEKRRALNCPYFMVKERQRRALGWVAAFKRQTQRQRRALGRECLVWERENLCFFVNYLA